MIITKTIIHTTLLLTNLNPNPTISLIIDNIKYATLANNKNIIIPPSTVRNLHEDRRKACWRVRGSRQSSLTFLGRQGTPAAKWTTVQIKLSSCRRKFVPFSPRPSTNDVQLKTQLRWQNLPYGCRREIRSEKCFSEV